MRWLQRQRKLWLLLSLKLEASQQPPCDQRPTFVSSLPNRVQSQKEQRASTLPFALVFPAPGRPSAPSCALWLAALRLGRSS